jgi:hypothetical protein
VTETSIARQVRIAGRPFVLRSADVVRAVCELDPEPIASHFVVIETRRFPPKQVISAVTGLDRADFTTHQARRTLMRLGFSAGRRGVGVQGEAVSAGASDGLASRLLPLRGQWVALKDQDVLHAAATPHELVAWLGEHGQTAESMFRVPEDELAATGLAPR